LLKDQVLQAALTVLRRSGLDRWTTAAVAREAGCAKGLVHYHYHDKETLLAAAARALTSERSEARLAAFAATGTAALDALWRALSEEVASGGSAARLGLAGHSSAVVRRGTRPAEDYFARLDRAVAASLDLASPSPSPSPSASPSPAPTPAPPAGLMRAVDATLDGLELALLRGDAEDAVHEAFHRIWWTVI